MTDHSSAEADSGLLASGIIFFNDRRYFEAHEVWEDLWRQTAGPLRPAYQGLVQAAVALHHLERRNLVGARSMLRKALEHLAGTEALLAEIDVAGLVGQLREIEACGEVRQVRIARLK